MSENRMPEDFQIDLWLANAKIGCVLDWRNSGIKQLPICCHKAEQIEARRKRKILYFML